MASEENNYLVLLYFYGSFYCLQKLGITSCF